MIRAQALFRRPGEFDEGGRFELKFGFHELPDRIFCDREMQENNEKTPIF